MVTNFGRKALVCIVGCIWLLCGANYSLCNNPQRAITRRETAVTNLLESAKRWEGVRELTGRNDHPMITEAMKLCGLPGNKNYAWCAASLAEIFYNAGIPAPHSARVVDWFRYNVIWKTDWGVEKPLIFPGTVGALYYEHLGRYGHIILITGQDKNNYYCLEGNTNVAGSREGDGFYHTIRSKRDIDALADYCVSGADFREMYEEYIQKNKR